MYKLSACEIAAINAKFAVLEGKLWAAVQKKWPSAIRSSYLNDVSAYVSNSYARPTDTPGGIYVSSGLHTITDDSTDFKDIIQEYRILLNDVLKGIDPTHDAISKPHILVDGHWGTSPSIRDWVQTQLEEWASDRVDAAQDFATNQQDVEDAKVQSQWFIQQKLREFDQLFG